MTQRYVFHILILKYNYMTEQLSVACYLKGRFNQGYTHIILCHFHIFPSARRGSLVVSALDSGSRGPGSSLGQVIVLCSWARHFTLKVPPPPRSKNGYQQTVRETRRNAGRLPAMD